MGRNGRYELITFLTNTGTTAGKLKKALYWLYHYRIQGCKNLRQARDINTRAQSKDQLFLLKALNKQNTRKRE
jgi:hypothetical protein